jgi:tRNA (guanine9-N1)-methyltransferase
MSGYKGQVEDKFKQSYKQIEQWDFSRSPADLVEIINSGDLNKTFYLSADAEEDLITIEDDATYVIGGIVDRNRHKVRWLRQQNMS